MSGRRARALKATMNRAERRRVIRRTATPPKVLAEMIAELHRLDVKHLHKRWPS